MKDFLSFVILLIWIAGVNLATGWTSTIVAIIFPPWAFYLVVEKLLQTIGWL